MFQCYRSGARRRGLQFDLTAPQFDALIVQACHYCGAPPSATHGKKGKREPVIANGIDRLDSALGYSPANCVPCCRTCNMAKMATPYADFVAWVLRAARHLAAPAMERTA